MMLKTGLKGKRGFALAAVLLAMTLAIIIIPVLYRLTERDSSWSVQQKHSSLAMELATAGIDRAIWKLKETNDNWYYVKSTGPISGYNFDQEYSDVSEDGVYRVQITTEGAALNQLIIYSEAKDKKANVYRAVRAVAEKPRVSAALTGHEVFSSTEHVGNITVHWGPIHATGNMILTTDDNNQYYPQKYAGGSITVLNSTGVYSSRDTTPDSPNTDNTEYWSYYEVPPILTPDLDYYRDVAQTNGTYWSSPKTLTSSDFNSNGPDQVYYCEDTCVIKNQNKFAQGIFIAETVLDLRGRNEGVSSPDANDYSTTPPGVAPSQYNKNTPASKGAAVGSLQPDTSAEDEYPGDGGAATVKSFQFGDTDGGASGVRPVIKGLVYVGTELVGNDKQQVIHGAVVLSKTAEISTGVLLEIFYNPDDWAITDLRTSSLGIYVSQWEEVESTPF